MSTKTHEILLAGYQAIYEPAGILCLGTRESHGTEQLHLTLAEDWKGRAVTAVFTNHSSIEVIMHPDGTVPVPPEATAYATGPMQFGRIVFKGTDADSCRLTTDLYFTVEEHSAAEGENSLSPTPDQYAQFVEAAGKISAAQVGQAVESYLAENPVESVSVDDTLTKTGMAADAGAVGKALAQLEQIPGPVGPQGPAGEKGAPGADGKDYSFDPTVYRLPVLYLTGDTTEMTKENPVSLSYVYGEQSGSCTMKWQGSSSLAWDKKNYTIEFGTAFEAADGWGTHAKYCLKANWIDHSHARNVVSAKLWGLIRKNRTTLPETLRNLPNAGAIDGFPIVVMLNGAFHGLYSFNIPKDAWMFGMGSGTKEAIVTADNQADDTAFKAETLLNADGLELEYASDGFDAASVQSSMNTLIQACMNSWGGDLDTTVAQVLDWDSAIDYYIFTVILKGGDMIQKNTVYATFDGVKWYFSAYDMDSTYGLAFDGSALSRAVSNVSFAEAADSHKVFELIKRFKTNELKARYKALRENELSETRICQYFENYAWDISAPLLMEDVKKWPSIRGSAVNGVDQICRWVRQRLGVTDAWMDALPAQETPVEPETPTVTVNQVPISTDTDGSIYNGTGYKDNARLSSSGETSGTAQTGSVTTGFIPWTFAKIVRVKGAVWRRSEISAGHFYFVFYDSNKTKVASTNAASYLDGNSPGASITYDAETGITTFDFSGAEGEWARNMQSSAYIRLNAYGTGANLIVTVDGEIS